MEFGYNEYYVSSLTRNKVDPNQWLNFEINALKVEYFLYFSTIEHARLCHQKRDKCITNLYALLKVAKEINGSQTYEIYLLLAVALLECAALAQENERKLRVVQIACLLESAHEYMPENRQLSLLLVRIYCNLGLGSLFMYHFHKLKIKDILNEPLAHHLFTRISITHPLSLSSSRLGTVEESARDPYLLGCHAIEKSVSATKNVNRLIANIQNNPLTSRLPEYIALKRDLSSSQTRQIVLLEHRRLVRLTAKTSNTLHLSETGMRALLCVNMFELQF